MRRILHAIVALLLLSSMAARAASDPLIFSAAPTHSRSETLKLYTPLVEYLSEATGRRFILYPAGNFIEYTVRMRTGKYDMLFDGPHLTSWRMLKQQHQPLARLSGEIRIVVVVPEGSAIDSMEKLAGGPVRVCAYPSPNMLTMAFLAHYPDPRNRPHLVRAHTPADLMSCLMRGLGDALVLRDTVWNAMNEREKAGLKLLAAPERSYPERTFSVGSRVDEPLRKKISEALLSGEGQRVLGELLRKLNKERLVVANAADYEGLEALLKPVWGFHRP